jgi:uracil phosphoribosyltransferase
MAVALHVVDHPLIADSLTRVRDKDTPNALFRQELERIGTLLMAEATRGLPTHAVRVQTPLTETLGRQLNSQPVVVPVLRAGLGFLGAAQDLLPNADVGFIGVARDEETHQPKPYVNKLPENLAGRQIIVLDPMLATGGSLAHTCKLLVERGATGTIIVVCVLAARRASSCCARAGSTSRSTPPRSTSASTRRRSSCPASATPATASSARPPEFLSAPRRSQRLGGVEPDVRTATPPSRHQDQFLAFYDDTFTEAYRYAGRLCGGNRDAAEDLVQDAYMAVLRQFRADPSRDLSVGYVITTIRTATSTACVPLPASSNACGWWPPTPANASPP